MGVCLSGSQSVAQSISQPAGDETIVIPQAPYKYYNLEGEGAQTTVERNAGTAASEFTNLRSRGFYADTPGTYFVDPDGDGYGVQVSIGRTPRTRITSNGPVISGYKVTQTETRLFRTRGELGNPVTGAQITDGSVTGADIAPETLTGSNVQDGSLTGADIASETITGANVRDGSLTGADIASETLTGSNVQDGSLTGADIASETITGANVRDGSLTGADIQDQSIAQADLSDNSVGTDQIIDDSVTGADIQNESLQNEDLATNSVNSRTIENNSIRLEDLNGEVSDYIDASNAQAMEASRAYTDYRADQLQSQIDRNAEIANDGIAMALAAKVPSLAEDAEGAFSIGLGHYSGSTALAAGGTAWLPGTDTQLYGTVGYGFKSSKIGASIGLMFSF